MSATIHLSERSAIQLDSVNATHAATVAGVLLTLQGRHHGELLNLNCGLIPLDRIGILIESLCLVASQVQP